MLRFILSVLVTAWAALLSQPVAAQDPWVLIATKDVRTDNRAGNEAIDTSAAKGSYKAIRLIAKENRIELSNVEIVYSDAPSHNERRPIALNVNDRTRPIDPRDGGRFVDRVVLTFKPTSEKEPTTVEVWGQQTPALARATRTAAAVAAPPVPAAPTPPPVVAPSAPSPVAAPAPPAKQEPAANADVLFGTQTIGFGVDRDVIRVSNEVGKFDRIRLRVLDSDLFLRTVRVVYADGQTEEITIETEIKQNQRTRWLPLKSDRFIKEIQIVYNAKPNLRGRAYVEVYGQYADGWLGPQGAGRGFNQGFVLLGGQTAGFTIDRNDRIEVGPNEGGFRKVRVNVRDEAITLFEVRVVYGSGEVDIIPANRTRIEAGGTFGPFDLKGGARVIREIRPTYRTRVFQQNGIARSRAVVEFWGQH